MYKIGIDLGGTKIEGAVLDKDYNIIERKRISTQQELGYNRIIENIHSLYTDLSSSIKNSAHTFGIGTPGSVSLKTGFLKNSNTTCLNGMPFLSDLEKKLNRKVAIENDANCFAMAEALSGSGKGFHMVFGVIMGTGCGGGIIYKGEVIRGKQSLGGEWGHTVLDPHGPECYCGKHGCVEKYISGGGLEQIYFKKTGIKKVLKEIIAEAESKTAPSYEIIEDFFKNFGLALSNVINILDPDVVVLGGGLSNIEDLYTKGIKEVYKNIFNDFPETPIIKNTCGDSAGVIGAALIGI